jgi:sterol desaturase/sphingolipid hydroxylase (fatty acid hydroxylase superfamily)
MEAWWLRRSGRAYSLNAAVSNMTCGMLNLCTGIFSAIAFAFLYRSLETKFGVIDGLGWQWWSFAVAFVVVDLCYYAYHRASHRIGVLWGAHIVHHESDEYNLTLSLRQGSVALFSSIPFYLPAAVMGIPLEVFLAASGIYQLYQFFVHTALVKNMGWLEHILATPRLHRLHHARNEPYIDCNYSGFLILWDKVFGTYRPPSVQPLFGVTSPLVSWSPIWANVSYFSELFRCARNRRGLDRIRTFLAPPEWQPAGESTKYAPLYVPYNAHPVSPFFHRIAVACFGAGIALTFVLLALPLEGSLPARSATAFCVAAAAWFSTKLFDGAFKNSET